MSELIEDELKITEIEILGDFFYVDPIRKSDDKFIIAGYANFNEIDKENEHITLEALEEAFERMMSIRERRNLNFHHTNIQVGRILPEYVDSSGKSWESSVDDNGLFIVAEVFQDIKMGRELAEKMEGGEYLSFSIGGQALERQKRCDDSICWKEIVKLDLHEVTSCQRGKNISSKGFIVKSDSGAFIPIEDVELTQVVKRNDTFNSKTNTLKTERNMSGNKDKTQNDDVEIEKSDLQIVLDALKEQGKTIEALMDHMTEKAEDPEEEPVEKEEEENQPESISKDEVKDMITGELKNLLLELQEEKEKEKKAEEEKEEKMDEIRDVVKEEIEKYLKSLEEEKEEETVEEKQEDEEEEEEEEEEEKARKKSGPRTEAQRAMAHFDISVQEWNELSEEEKQEYIDRLPARGSADKPKYYYYKKPKKEDFEEEEEFEKALKQFNELKDSLRKELEKEEEGEIITKSQDPGKNTNPDDFSFSDLFKKSEKYSSIEDFLAEEGIEL